jgi:putative membrane protein
MSHSHSGGLHFFPAPITVAVLVAGVVYLCGWLRLRAVSPTVVPAWRVTCGLSGLLSVWVAVGSPLAALDHQWLTIHMIQHLLLMTVAAPLILLGRPVVSALHALPGPVVSVLRSWSRTPVAQRIGETIAHPVVCWCAAALTLTLWHVPAALTTAMHSPTWHLIQHTSFLFSGLLFWWPVVQRWPGATTEPHWSMVLYLFLATLPCDVLSAFLVFSERVAYPIYLATSGRSVASVLEDQQYAGALMWTCVTLVYVAVGAIVSMRLLAVRDPAHDNRARRDIAGY